MNRCKIFYLLCVFTFVSLAQVNAQTACQDGAPLAFTNWKQESGTYGALNSVYRFEDVTTGIDALVTILDMDNASLVSLDKGTYGSYDAFQPQVEMLYQNYYGTKAYMDFGITFVATGTNVPVELSDWKATAIDVDGDDYRLREMVAFVNASAYTMENLTALVPETMDMRGETAQMFEAQFVTTQSGISTTATEHMVSMEFRSKNSFIYRTAIVDEGGEYYWSSAPDRMFSLNFSPCLLGNYSNPKREIMDANFPVEWAEFKATEQENGVLLDWATTHEENNQLFVVQKSTDGLNFEDLDQLKAVGDVSKHTSYEYLDRTADKGRLFYRIMQQDMDGTQSHSRLIEIEVTETKGMRIGTHSNGSQLQIRAQYAPESQIRIVHSSGALMYKGTIQGQYEEKTVEVSNWATGVYWIIVNGQDGNIFHASFIK